MKAGADDRLSLLHSLTYDRYFFQYYFCPINLFEYINLIGGFNLNFKLFFLNFDFFFKLLGWRMNYQKYIVRIYM